MDKKNVILEKSFEFALELITYCEELENTKKYVIAKQLLREGTSIGANIRESQSCESRADFIHKLKISAKEASETEFWLLLCQHSKSYPKNDIVISKLHEKKNTIKYYFICQKRSTLTH